MSQFVSPKELATAIGASESSLKRWVDNGHLAVNRTAGGHRRIPVPEAIRFIRQRKLTVVRPDILGLGGLTESQGDTDPATDEERLHELLVNGRLLEARSLITSLFLQGASIASIADGPITHALERIGTIWKHSKEGIVVEHRALEACIYAVNALRPYVEPREGVTAPIAIGSSLPSDPYVLPNQIAAAVLEECGYAATNLGADLPTSLLMNEARRLRPTLVWVSASLVVDPDTASRELSELLDILSGWNATLIVGGREADRLTLPESPLIGRCSGMVDLMAAADRVLASGRAGEPAA